MENIASPYNPEARGVITGIGHGTMRDGPGWRSIIYFKGCNFRCKWCSSPETFTQRPHPMFFPERLKYPERLSLSCPRSAIFISSEKSISVDREKCRTCESYDCAGSNIDGAVELSGNSVSISELINETLPYKRAHERYGVTLSGGEATFQWEFFIELLKAFRHHGLHTAVETNCSNPRLPECFKYLDLAICDLKLIDPSAHERWNGYDNETVLKNIATAAESGVDVWVRIPVVPGVTDGENLQHAAHFLSRFNRKTKVELLAYHALGVYKWAACGLEYELEGLETPHPDAIREMEKIFTAKGLEIIRT